MKEICKRSIRDSNLRVLMGVATGDDLEFATGFFDRNALNKPGDMALLSAAQNCRRNL